MKSLIFLTTRRIKNAIRRSFKTPARGIMTVLMIAYFLFAFATFFFSKGKTPQLITGIPDIDLQIATSVLLFTQCLLFAFLLPPPRYTFSILSEVDVANIYPTPQKSWSVIRYFLFTRSFPFVFLFYCLIGIYVFKFARMIILVPDTSINGWQTSLHLSMYVFLTIISLSAIIFWRFVIDIRKEFGLIPKKTFLFSMTIIIGIILISSIYYVQEAISAGKHPLIGFTKSIESFPSLFLLYPLKSHALLLVGKFETLPILFSAFFWSVFSIAGYCALRAEETRLYEYAARIATFRAGMKNLLRNPAELVKEKKLKKKQTLELPLLFRVFKPKRGYSILWKDGIITWRSYGNLTKLLISILIPAIIGIWFLIKMNIIQFDVKVFRAASIIGIVLFLIPYCLSSIMIFAETLKKAEVQKPLPVSSLQAVTMHILQWTMMTCVTAILTFFTAAILFPFAAYQFLFALIAGCSFAYVINSGFFFIVLFNPDMLDPIQRMYASLFGLVLSVAACIPGIAVLLIGSIVHLHKLIILLLLIIVNLASVFLLHFLSSKKYENFLFTE